MLHVRIITPPTDAPAILDLLSRDPATCDVVRLAGAGHDPTADLVMCDVARERASGLLADVERLGLGDRISISLIEISAMVSAKATAAVAAAGGRPADGVVWEEVEQGTSQQAGLSFTFMAFMAIATLIGAVGVLTDSQVLIVGAMIVGPDFGPLAGLCVALADGRRAMVRRSSTALVVGFGWGIACAVLLTLIVRAFGAGPDQLGGQSQPFTRFITHPDGYSVIVAALAGIGGLLTVTQARSGALIGILVSVTTIPAASSVAVAIGYTDRAYIGGALAQLGINIVTFVIAGVLTYRIQRSSFRRRIARRGLRVEGRT